MTTYDPPLRDMRFVLNEFLQVQNLSNLPGFAEATPDLIDAILEEGAKLHSEVIHPINQSGDQEGCHHEGDRVTTPKGFKEAYDTYSEGGWNGLTFPEEYGGQGLPYAIGIAISEMTDTANVAFAMDAPHCRRRSKR